jgi:long-chain acyl-CoA synthetase
VTTLRPRHQAALAARGYDLGRLIGWRHFGFDLLAQVQARVKVAQDNARRTGASSRRVLKYDPYVETIQMPRRNPHETQLDRLFAHEKNRGEELWLTQPVGGGALKELTYASAMKEARSMAAWLRGLELPAGSHIVIFAKNNAWWFLADIAIWLAGHVSIPLYPTLTPETVRQILTHSGAKHAFIGKLDGFDAMAVGIPDDVKLVKMPLAPDSKHLEDATLWTDIVARTAPITDDPKRKPDELATIIYTSGTTGAPKGVMHSFASLCSAQGYIDELNINPSDRMLSYLPLAHSLERTLVEMTSMLVGFHVFFAESLERFVDDLKRARPTLFVSVPRLWHKFQSGVLAKMPAKKLALFLKIPILRGIVRRKILNGLGLAEVRFAGSGSAPIPAELIAWYRDLGLELLEGYGMTENSSYSHMTRPGEVRVGYVGRPQPGVEQKLSAEGEILVKSPGNTLGYYKAPELTAEMLDAEGFVHTGDLGSIDEKGRLKITGRVKELFKTSKGKYVAPAPIENELLLHEAIEAACVTGGNRPQPFALVLLAEHVRGTVGALPRGGGATEVRAQVASARAQLADALAEHMKTVNAGLDPHERLEKLVVIGEPWTIENGMLTPSLKIKRAAVESRYAPYFEAWHATSDRVVWYDG